MNETSLDFPLFNTVSPRSLPAKSGWTWINEGVRYVVQAKLNWMVMLSTFGFLFALVRLAPPLFQLLAFMLFPVFVSGIASACNDIERGRRFTPAHVFKGLSNPNIGSLFRYGLFLFLLLILSQVISTFIINSMGYTPEIINAELKTLMDSKTTGLSGIMSSEALKRYFIVMIICMLPIMAIQFLAPIILTFTRLNASQAIILSLQGTLKNLLPVIVYVLILGVLLFVPITLYNALIGFLFADLESINFVTSFVIMVVFFMIISMILALTYSSAYVAFKDIYLQPQRESD